MSLVQDLSDELAAPTHRRDRLKVLLVTEASGGGVGRHFLDLAQGLTAAGVEVCGVYAPGRVDALFRERLAQESMPDLRELPLRRAIHPLDLADTWRLVRLARRHGPFDVIHGHSSKGGAIARLAAQWLGIPSVYTPNAFITLNPTLPPWRLSIYRRIEAWLARRTAAIIAVSHDEARHAQEIGIDPRRVHVVPNAIRPTAFADRQEARRRLQLGPDQVTFGFVGRLTDQKAPDVMLRAFAQVAAKLKNVRLVMVGEGPLRGELERLIAQVGLESRVQLLGDVVALGVMPAFDVFCLSSRYEGLPYVLLESLAAGLPIVATSVCGVRMAVTDGANGLLVAPDDPAALADAMLRVASDGQLRQRFGEASRIRADEFSLDSMVERTIEIYRNVVKVK